MAKWNKSTFLVSAKDKCEPRVQTVIMDLIRFSETDADQVSWGRGSGYGTMTFKCKSDDFGGRLTTGSGPSFVRFWSRHGAVCDGRPGRA